MSSRRTLSWGLHIASAKREALSLDQLDANKAARAAKLAALQAEIAAEGRVGYELRETDLSVPSYREYHVVLDGVTVGKITDEVGVEGAWLVANRGVNTLPERFPGFASHHQSVAEICRLLGAKRPN